MLGIWEYTYTAFIEFEDALDRIKPRLVKLLWTSLPTLPKLLAQNITIAVWFLLLIAYSCP